MSKTVNLQAIPYLSFDGQCAEAFRFYADVLGGTITVMMTGKDAPIPDEMMKGFGDRILNAQLVLPGGSLLYGGDAPGQYQGIKGVSMTLNFDTTDEAEGVFNRLAEGGSVNMPFSPTFWAEKFGMVTDKYGVDWIINGHPTPIA